MINIRAPRFGEGGPEMFSHLLAWWPCEYSLSLLQTEAQGLAWWALGKPTRISNTRGQTKLYERMVVATATKLTGHMKSDANGTRSLSARVDCSRTSRTNKIQEWIIKAVVPTRGRMGCDWKGRTYRVSKVLSHNVGAGCPRMCSLFEIPGTSIYNYFSPLNTCQTLMQSLIFPKIRKIAAGTVRCTWEKSLGRIQLQSKSCGPPCQLYLSPSQGTAPS